MCWLYGIVAQRSVGTCSICLCVWVCVLYAWSACAAGWRMAAMKSRGKQEIIFRVETRCYLLYADCRPTAFNFNSRSDFRETFSKKSLLILACLMWFVHLSLLPSLGSVNSFLLCSLEQERRDIELHATHRTLLFLGDATIHRCSLDDVRRCLARDIWMQKIKR